MHTYQHLALNLRLFRIKRRLTQADLAARVLLGQRYISDLERGLFPSTHEHVERLAAVLGTTSEILLGDTAIQLTTTALVREEAHAR